MQIVKREFTVANVRATIEKANQHAAAVFDQLYQRTIDFGAHPNERAITGSLSIEDLAERKLMEQLYLHGDGITLDHVVKTTAQAAVCSLEIFSAIFPERFERLGVSAALLELRKRL